MAEISVMENVPEKVIIPLKQHNGTVCEALVSKGDMVKEGQKIGECTSDFCASVHSSICGEVVSIEEAPMPSGTKVMSVIIQPGEENECVDFTPQDATGGDLISIIKDAGIVENYGVPTHLVLKPGDGCTIDTVLVNATSAEWIWGDYKEPRDYALQILESLKLLMKASGASKGAIVLRNDNSESISAFDGLVFEGKRISVSPLVGKRRASYYFKDQQSDIVVLSQNRIYGKSILDLFTYNVTGRRVPFNCKPASTGVAICSVQSAKAFYDVVHEGRPYIETVISVTGKVNKPQKILVKIGTPFKDVIEACGGYKGEPGKLIANGAITGVAQYVDEVPVTKTTLSITVQDKGEVLRDEPLVCVHCARCVDVCPVDLIPSRLATLADQGRFDESNQMYVSNCIECGRCSAACPTKIPILQLIRYAKEAIEKAYDDTAPKESSNLELGCSCGSV
ncbi:electron transport complex protein RnfC [Methanohalophilus levihalophilus]|uniref:Rnf electron transport complex subunit RnfC n=1 Tax=Methanohalophilus levihalophilus TaxID=1431282 RepID=UPI001FD97BDB|nr:Rnf electron transport complex subunit RnfC [Methanohalophilus levihalophilus]MBP2030881.1 electron transport complex protein RnfC [Methanohalophilus levihalophilus]